MIVKQRLQGGQVAIDDGVDRGFEGIDGRVATSDGGDKGGEGFSVGEVVTFRKGRAGVVWGEGERQGLRLIIG